MRKFKRVMVPALVFASALVAAGAMAEAGCVSKGGRGTGGSRELGDVPGLGSGAAGHVLGLVGPVHGLGHEDRLGAGLQGQQHAHELQAGRDARDRVRDHGQSLQLS